MRVCRALRALTVACCAASLLLFLASQHNSGNEITAQHSTYVLNRRLEYESQQSSEYDEDEGEFGDNDIVEDTTDDSDEDDDDYTNPEFQLADFQLIKWEVPHLTEQPIFSSNASLTTSAGIVAITNGIFWSQHVEEAGPEGIRDDQVTEILTRLRAQVVTQVDPPTWLRCGSPKNQFVTLADGSNVCARYRAPHDYLVHGELMSFYLARLLGLQNVPVVALSHVSSESPQWSSVNVTMAIQEAGWEDDTIVAFIQWINGLERDRMPYLVLDALQNNKTVGVGYKMLQHLSIPQLWQLMQWSELVIFDYLTGNYDRVASMQDAADKEKKNGIMRESIHNLAKETSTGSIWLIDNESGLLDGYSLMYSATENPANPGHRFIKFHEDMLRTFCVFKESTVNGVAYLHTSQQAHVALIHFISKYEPLLYKLPNVLEDQHFVEHFQERVDKVWSWVTECEVSSRRNR